MYHGRCNMWFVVAVSCEWRGWWSRDGARGRITAGCGVCMCVCVYVCMCVRVHVCHCTGDEKRQLNRYIHVHAQSNLINSLRRPAKMFALIHPCKGNYMYIRTCSCIHIYM